MKCKRCGGGVFVMAYDITNDEPCMICEFCGIVLPCAE